MPHIQILNGSPSAESRTGCLLDHFAEQRSFDGWSVNQTALRILPDQALLSVDFDAQPLVSAALAVEEADAIVVAAPVYKGAYIGLLNAFIDTLAHRALVNKNVLPSPGLGSENPARRVWIQCRDRRSPGKRAPGPQTPVSPRCGCRA